MRNDAWVWKPLGALFAIGAGKTMSRAAREGAGRVPFLRTSNVLWDEMDISHLDEMALSDVELNDKCVQEGDLLVCEGGEIGRAAVWDGKLSPLAFQNHLHRLRPKSEDVYPRFYVYFLQSAFTQLGMFEGAGNKTTIPNISRNRLASLEVPHPPIEEQRAVARGLALVRNGIRNHREAVARSEEFKRATMHEIFTRGLRGALQEETEIGFVPQGWSPRSVLELCEIWSGGTPRKSIAAYWGGDIPWVSGKDLKAPALDDTIDHLSLAGVEAGSRLAPAGAVLLLVRGMGLARDLPVAVIRRPMAFNQDVKALVSRGRYSGSFLRSAIYQWKERLLSQIVPSAHGTMTLNLNDVENFKVSCPDDPAEAEEVVSILDAIDRKIDLHYRKQALLEELFKSLLLHLMTGEVRVSNLDLSALPESNAAEAIS